MENMKTWIDYSSLSTFIRCPRAYYLRIVRGVDTADTPSSLLCGKAFHAAKAAYLISKKSGKPHEESMESAIVAMTEVMSGIKNPDDIRNASSMVDTLQLYLEWWQNEDYSIEDVEVQFAVDIGDFIYAGVIDAIKRHPAFGMVVEETKTTSVPHKWDSRAKPNMQLDGYIAAAYILTGELAAGSLDIVPLTKKPTKPFRILTMRGMDDIASWLTNVQGWWQSIKSCHERGFFPQNTDNCAPLIGFGCQFHVLCGMGDINHIKDEDLPSQYVIREWKPFPELEKEVIKCSYKS